VRAAAVAIAARLSVPDIGRPRGSSDEGPPPKVVGPQAGDFGWLASIGVRFIVSSEDSRRGFSLVEHPMRPKSLAAPLHRQSREDEYSSVLEGWVGAMLGQNVIFGGPGDLIFKPRDQWHTFWNAGGETARILEIICPSGFERYFREMVALPPDAPPETRAEVASRYGLEVDPASIPDLVEQHGLRWGRAAD
jgi:mannose-6-phosphate isomerase-like protein (cupin superfamily)